MPTELQKIAVKKLAELSRKSKGQKNITIGRILREAGYSETVSLSPTKVTESKGFKQLLDEFLPDSKLAAVHDQLLDAKTLDTYQMDAKLTDEEVTKIVEDIKGCKVRKIVRFPKQDTVTVYFYRPDNLTRDRALDKGYKLRGHYAPEKQELDITAIKVVKYGSKDE